MGDFELEALIGLDRLELWHKTRALIERLYDMEILESGGGKNWENELKYRRGGKTLCGLYVKKDYFGVMIIFGSRERERLEEIRPMLSFGIVSAYDGAQTYHDGKWVMFEISDDNTLSDIEKMLFIKRKPNKK